MPADIRNWFGGSTATPIREKDTKKEEGKKKRSGKSLPRFWWGLASANKVKLVEKLLLIVMTMKSCQCKR